VTFSDFLAAIGLAFVPVFAAMNPLDKVPVFVSLTAGMDCARRRRLMRQAILVSLCIAVFFAVVGDWIFRLLSIRKEDFQIGGGLLLFAIAALDLLGLRRQMVLDEEIVGVFPLATPLIAGPALLTTMVLMVQKHRLWPSLVVLGINLLLTWGAMLFAEHIMKRVGRAVLMAISKVMMILLAAIGVMLVREGVIHYVRFK